MEKRTFRVLAVIFALLGAASSLYGVVQAVFFEYGGFVPGLFDKFTVLSNLLNVIVSVTVATCLIQAIRTKKERIPVWVEVSYLVSTVCLTLTLGVVYGYLAWFTPMGVNAMIGLPSMLFVHTISPILAMVTFLFFLKENRLPMNDVLICLAFPLAYGLVWVGLQLFKVVDASALPYPFLDISGEWWKPTVWFIGLAIGTGLVAALWIFVHNFGLRPTVAESASPEAETAETIKGEPRPAKPENEGTPQGVVTPGPKQKEESGLSESTAKQPDDGKSLVAPAGEPNPSAISSSNAYKDGARVYHISQHPDGGWQVKLATGEKAIQIFKTQAEAIDFAKGLEKTQGGSIRIHSVKGTIRKE